MSLNHIDNYRSDGEITLLIEHKTDSEDGVVTDSLAGELNNFGFICVFYRIVNLCLHAQYKALQKSVERFYGEGVLGDSIIAHVLVDTRGTRWRLQIDMG